MSVSLNSFMHKCYTDSKRRNIEDFYFQQGISAKRLIIMGSTIQKSMEWNTCIMVIFLGKEARVT